MDEKYMLEALELAKTAASLGEVPVGAVVVRDGEIIGKGYNLRENKKSASAHAEIIAIVNSRIDRVVYGCKDVVAGCCGSVINFNAYPFNHSFTIESGVCETQATELLKGFFEDKRKRENK